MAYLQTRITSHAARVRSLYRAALRNERSLARRSIEYRFAAIMLRERFEKHRNEKDLRYAKKLVMEGEKELDVKMHSQPLKFQYSPGGAAFQREVPLPDSLYDIWHPLEKAQYPEFFARREIRKQENIDAWQKKYGAPTPQ